MLQIRTASDAHHQQVNFLANGNFRQFFNRMADKMRAVFQIGHPIEELLNIAVREKVDLLVMGVRGRSDLEHVLVGSVAEKLFRRSPVPILSYRDDKSAARIKRRMGIK